MTRSRKLQALIAGAALIAMPATAFAQSEVTEQANEVAEQAEQLQQEANALSQTANAAQGAGGEDVDEGTEEQRRDGDGFDWGLLGLLGLAGLLGLKRRDRDDHNRGATTGRTDRL